MSIYNNFYFFICMRIRLCKLFVGIDDLRGTSQTSKQNNSGRCFRAVMFRTVILPISVLLALILRLHRRQLSFFLHSDWFRFSISPVRLFYLISEAKYFARKNINFFCACSVIFRDFAWKISRGITA